MIESKLISLLLMCGSLVLLVLFLRLTAGETRAPIRLVVLCESVLMRQGK